MSPEFDYSGICDFRTSEAGLSHLVKHPTGVQFKLNIWPNNDSIDVFIDELVSTDHQLKVIDITLTHVLEYNGTKRTGDQIASEVITDFRFDGKRERLIKIPKEVLFEFVCLAEVEPRSVKSDLKQQFLRDPDNPAFADMTLECGDVELKCHSFMLAARSPVFRAALSQTGFLEEKTRRIKIEELDVDVLRQLIEFIYTDSVDIEEVSFPELFSAADRFDIPNLRSYCLKRMINNVDVSSAAAYFRLAHLHKQRELLKKSARVIRKRYDKVKATPGWEFFRSDPRLLEELLDQSFSKN